MCVCGGGGVCACGGVRGVSVWGWVCGCGYVCVCTCVELVGLSLSHYYFKTRQFLEKFDILSITAYLRSFGHQGALYYVFLASDPLKTSREYAVFTLRTRGPKVCTRETSRQTQRVSAFFVLIAPNDRITSYIAGHWRLGQNFMMFQRMKNETWFSKNGNIKNLVQKTKMEP